MSETLRSNPTREAILILLKEKRFCQYDLWKALKGRKDLPHPPIYYANVGFHLRVLVKQGLIERCKPEQASANLDKIPYRLVKQK